MRCIAVINQKGGVGKTTTTVNLGAALAQRGFHVLLLDMDPQANLTVHVDKRPDLEGNTMTNLMVEDRPLAELVQTTGSPRLCVVPSDTSLAGVEQVLANRIGRETILREALERFPRKADFDFLLLDCPPSLGVLSANALVAAEHVVIPMQAEYLSLQGMAKLIEVIQLVQKRLNPGLRVAMVLPCMVDSRTNLSIEVLREIEEHFGGQLARTRIRNNVKLAEAPSFGRTIFEHAPESNGARDYEAAAAELVEKLGADAPLPRPEGEAPGGAVAASPQAPTVGHGESDGAAVDERAVEEGAVVVEAPMPALDPAFSPALDAALDATLDGTPDRGPAPTAAAEPASPGATPAHEAEAGG